MRIVMALFLACVAYLPTKVSAFAWDAGRLLSIGRGIPKTDWIIWMPAPVASGGGGQIAKRSSAVHGSRH